MDTRWRIALVCGIAAWIGALVSLGVSVQYGWGFLPLPFGALTFGGVAYLAYDFPAAIRAVAATWRKLVGWRPEPDWDSIGDRLRLVFASATIGGTALAYTLALFAWPIGFIMTAATGEAKSEIAGFSLFGGIFGALLGTMVGAFTGASMCTTRLREHRKSEIAEALRVAKVWNPIVFPFAALWWLFTEGLPFAGPFAWRFTKEVFLAIHREERLLCAVDAAIGVTVGFFAGYSASNPLIGGLVGGVVGALSGILNYEIVSVRILGLVPVDKTV